MSEEMSEGTLFDMPSYQDWLNAQNERLDKEGFDPNTVDRGWRIAGETPLKFFSAVAYRAAYVGTRSYLRRQNRKAVPNGKGKTPYLTPDQMQLPDLLGWLIANYDRRLADAQSERRFVEDWCAAHPGYTAAAVYGQAGVEMPAAIDA